ncbi:hypothetical protein EFK50_10420 [Nocardioides marmoriginsengisoli]|uniref:Uncharacterized protein n=2 Tax=Nocardioides marmoriginsengisoli TaxID=661483 RepID=A0A3N0CFH9_9ACTN|nr:hypothetical protein EFK50_10420 [Nocardioides marmoriginsengisoli]
MGNLRERLRLRAVLTAAAVLAAIAVVAAPFAAEQAVERVRFDDRLGTLPVEVSLCHNGYSTVDTGILGSVYWQRTGMFGFGACIRVTEPPEAGGTLSSYVDESFVRTNAELINDPDEIAAAYGHEFSRGFRREFLRTEALLVGVGLLVLVAVRRRTPPKDEDRIPWWGERIARRLAPWPVARIALWSVLLILLGTTASAVVATYSFKSWSGSNAVGTTYPLPAVAGLSFSSPQTREVAGQVQPFIEKNYDRLRERGKEYEDTATASFTTALAARRSELLPRGGERVVLAEADPQGSLVGTAVRTRLYPILVEALGKDAIVLRTISGDITSNGTVAEDAFVRKEARSSGDIPTVAAAGDHDSETTVDQLKEYGVEVPDLETITVGGLRVSVGNDPEFKTLFGGSVTNPSGVSEEELGERLRKAVDPDRAGIVVLHQADAAAAYLGLSSLNELSLGHETVPYDDGIPDVPPGTVDVGHSHRSIGPFVVWNTDTDDVTWTVVDRLGTSGGAENSPTFNRFSTPFSTPLKPIDVRLQYFDEATGLQTGYATISIDPAGKATISERTDVGLPLGDSTR